MQKVLSLRLEADPSYTRRMRERNLLSRIDYTNRCRFYNGFPPLAYPASMKSEVRR